MRRHLKKVAGLARRIKHHFKQKQIEGFTILELMVVIAITGVLSSIVVVQTNSVRMRARDVRRIADLSTIKTALNQYYADNGTYPLSVTVPPVPFNAVYWYSCDSTWSNLQTALAPYLPKVPIDPINTSCETDVLQNAYTYTSQFGQDYNLFTFLEDPENPYACRNKPSYFHDWLAYLGSGCSPAVIASWITDARQFYADH